MPVRALRGVVAVVVAVVVGMTGQGCAGPAPKDAPGHSPGVGSTRSPGRTYLIVHVTDGDTLDLANGETVRLIGMDTPERGECGYDRATEHLADLVFGKRVTLVKARGEERDRYGRLLRYVDIGRIDAGLSQIRKGFAIARYDSRDGYGRHPREDAYIRADAAHPEKGCTEP